MSDQSPYTNTILLIKAERFFTNNSVILLRDLRNRAPQKGYLFSSPWWGCENWANPRNVYELKSSQLCSVGHLILKNWWNGKKR